MRLALLVIPTLLAAQTGINLPTQIQKPGGSKGDGVTDDTTAIANALATGKDVYVPPGIYQISGGGLTLSTNNQRLVCLNGSAFRAKAATGQILTITGTGNTVQGCTFDGASNGSNGSILVYPNGASQFQFLSNTLKNTVTGQYPFRCDNCTDSLIEGNIAVTGMLGAGLTVLKSSSNVQILGNTVVSSSTSGTSGSIDVEGGAGGTAVVQYITILGNSAVATTGFCYQVAISGGLSSSQIAIEGNTCTLSNATGTNSCASMTTPRVCGGISIPDSTDSVVMGNVIYGSGQNVDIGGIEYGNTRMTIADNTVYAGGGSSGAGSGLIGYCKQCRITGNVVNGWPTGGGSGGIKLETLSTVPNQDDNVIANNTVVLAAAVTGQSAFYLHCSFATTGTQNRNNLYGNTVVGVGTASNTAFNLFPDAMGCTIADAHLHNNQIYNMNKGLQLPGPTNLTILNNQYSTVTTPVACTACTYADVTVYGNLAVGKTTTANDALDVSGNQDLSGTFKGAGNGYVATGFKVGSAALPSFQTFEVNGTEAHNGTSCWSHANLGVANCNDTANEASPIIEVDGGDGTNAYRGRLQMQAGGGLSLDATDATSTNGFIQLHAGGTNFWKCFVNVGCLIGSTSLGGATAQGNGQIFYCTDCKNVVDDGATAGATCAGSGHGAIARRENGHWACN
jgi:hypothetical protein